MKNGKFRKELVFGIVLMLVFSVFILVQINVSAAGEYSSYFAGGVGTEGDPYQIANVDQLQNMNLDLEAHYVLVNDIDASETSTWNSDGTGGYYGFDPIGDYPNRFTGSLDGQGYSITGLFIDESSENHVGLFRYVGSGGSVSDVSLINNDINGYSCVGGLSGDNYGTISDCYATGTVSGNSYYVGGLSGANYNYGMISDCYATGTVSGNICVGGLSGYNRATISNCYATGAISGNSFVGGLIGYNYYSTVFNCFWDTETSSQSTSQGGTGKTTAEMKDVATFTDTSTLGLGLPWDFVGNPNDDTGSEDIWDISSTVNDGYPYLSWQITNQPPVADANGPYIGNEGSPIIFDASGSSDPDGDSLTYSWDLDGDGYYDDATGPTPTYTWYDDYSGTVSVEVSDGEYTDTDTATVTVYNVAPTANIDNVLQPYSEFILPDDVLEFTGSYTDPGTLDDHTYEWDFDDGTIVTGMLTPTHVYTNPGLYTVTLTVTDGDGVGTASVEIVVESQAEATDDVVEDVEEMDLPTGIETALTSTLDTAINSLDNGQTTAAVNQLGAFINQVEAQRGKKLTDEEADALIAAVQWIIDNLNEG